MAQKQRLAEASIGATTPRRCLALDSEGLPAAHMSCRAKHCRSSKRVGMHEHVVGGAGHRRTAAARGVAAMRGNMLQHSHRRLVAPRKLSHMATPASGHSSLVRIAKLGRALPQGGVEGEQVAPQRWPQAQRLRPGCRTGERSVVDRLIGCSTHPQQRGATIPPPVSSAAAPPSSHAAWCTQQSPALAWPCT